MATHTINKNIEFTTVPGKKYYLTVIIGQGQAGSSNFININGDFFSPEVVNAVIGSSSEIKNKSLNVVSVVMDINPSSNTIVVSYYITETPLNMNQLPAVTDHETFECQASETITFITKLNFK